MALIPCAECGNQISSAAVSCPHCGIAIAPAVNKPVKSKIGCLPLLLLATIAVVIVVLAKPGPTPPPTPEQAEKKKQEDAAFAADMAQLRTAGGLAVVTGDATKFEISGWNGSLDLYLGTLSAGKAASLSQYFCTRYFKPWKSSVAWKVRVYMVDEKVAAECPIRTGTR